jgi:hypothetical protein
MGHPDHVPPLWRGADQDGDDVVCFGVADLDPADAAGTQAAF